VIPASFDYGLAETVDHAIELLGRPDAKLLAGGHSLLPMMRLRFARPTLLVDIGRLDELRYIREQGDTLEVGALTRHADLARHPLLRGQCRVLAEAAELVGDPAVRHRGTLGGSAAHADPASDLPTVLLALDAEFVAHGPGGERTIAAAHFFTNTFESALGAREVLTGIRVPKSAAGAYLKFRRRAQDWATVGVAAVRVNGSTRIALTNMGTTPLRAHGVEEALAAGSDARSAAARATDGTSAPSDTSGSAEYRRHLARVLTRRAIEQLSY
jgi:aerobic carbon-monoxide dehydrogenase medium subunit